MFRALNRAKCSTYLLLYERPLETTGPGQSGIIQLPVLRALPVVQCGLLICAKVLKAIISLETEQVERSGRSVGMFLAAFQRCAVRFAALVTDCWLVFLSAFGL